MRLEWFATDRRLVLIFQLRETGKIESDEKINQGIEVGVRIKKNKTGSRYNNVDFAILHGWGIDNYTSAVNFLWDNKVFKKSGSYLNWEGKNIYRQDLIDMCAKEKVIASAVKTLLQNHWNGMIERAEIDRKPKWGD